MSVLIQKLHLMWNISKEFSGHTVNTQKFLESALAFAESVELQK